MDRFMNHSSVPKPSGFPDAVSQAVGGFKDSPVAWAVTGVLVFFLYLALDKPAMTDPKVPYGHSYLHYLPRFFSATYYANNAKQVIDQGYRKFKHQAFKLVRNDVNMMFIPPSEVDEVSALAPEIASNISALAFDLVGRWTGLNMLVDARLHHRVVQFKLTPNLAQSSKSVEDEVTLSVEEYFPQSEEWVEMQPYFVFMKMASRISSRVLVGLPWCHNKDWLEFSMNFTENVLNSIISMRFFPTWFYPILSYLLPSCWATVKNIKDAQDILGPAFAQKLKEQDEGTYKPANSEEPNGVEWLTELAKGNERDPIALVHCEILLALASVHTSLFTEINFLYDLMSNPKYFDILREEIDEVSRDPEGWGKHSYANLHKMDSALRESQRFNPPTLIGLRRIMKDEVTLSSGMVLPKGAYVAAATWSIQQGATENAEKFDGLRAYRSRQGQMQSSKGLFTSTEKTVLAWGLGKSACPGRWFASLALKTIFSKVLTEYDFKYLPGQVGRPKNDTAHEILFPDRDQKILVRRRQGKVAPFGRAR